MKNELTLDELLADPIVLTVMRADRVHPGRVGRQLRAIGNRLNTGADGRAVSAWLVGKTGHGEGCTW